MLTPPRLALLATPLVTLLLSLPLPAHAEEIIGVAPWIETPRGDDAATNESPREASSPVPDSRKIVGGLIAFGTAYVGSLGVAAGSGHRGDSYLYVPIAGPWLDLGLRGPCPAIGSCAEEAANRALLVAGGLLEAVGFLAVLGGYAFPVQPVTAEAKPLRQVASSLRLVPIGVANGGFGVGASGAF